MTSTATRPGESKGPPGAAPFGSRDQLLAGRKLETRVVEVPRLGTDGQGLRFRVRELLQGEVEEIGAKTIVQESDAEGKISAKADSRGYKARTVACALVYEDGSPYFAEPMVEFVHLNKLTPDVIDVLFKAVDEMSLLSVAERKKAGKASGKTTDSGG
jgi:hypothetical protein